MHAHINVINLATITGKQLHTHVYDDCQGRNAIQTNTKEIKLLVIDFQKKHLGGSKRQKEQPDTPVEMCILSFSNKTNFYNFLKEGMRSNVRHAKCSD